MLWFRTPEKVYIKQGCLSVALASGRGKPMARGFFGGLIELTFI